tara:strand:- start:33427 stop:33999 length:573 start_codon:yes stop_codon:yes gene_type:complete
MPHVRSSVEPASSSSYFNKPLGSYLKRCEVTVEEILDTGSATSSIPSGTKLLAMREKIEATVLKNVETRCTHSEGALRELQSMRKNRAPREREKEKDPEDRERKHKLKKVIKKHDEDGKHPPTTGAHGVTRQDGVDVHKGMSEGRYCVLALHFHHLNPLLLQTPQPQPPLLACTFHFHNSSSASSTRQLH